MYVHLVFTKPVFCSDGLAAVCMLRLCPFGLCKKRRASTPSETLCKFHEMAYVQLIDFLNYEILFSVYMSNLVSLLHKIQGATPAQ
jgi:hypothetical protein